MKLRKHTGYSLLELLVVIAISAISMAILFPKDLVARNTATEIQAIFESELISTQLGEQENSIEISENVFGEFTVPKGVTLEGRTISLYPSGVVTPRTIRITAQKAECYVSISLRGRVRKSCLSI